MEIFRQKRPGSLYCGIRNGQYASHFDKTMYHAGVFDIFHSNAGLL